LSGVRQRVASRRCNDMELPTSSSWRAPSAPLCFAQRPHYQELEYEDESWVGEARGFTEVLRLTRDPKVVRSVVLDLVTLVF
jgi:hypothetical protein